MSVLEAIVLGIVQGITEFAPISSSGHLILVPWILGWDRIADPSLAKAFDVALHLGTLAGAAIYFRRDLARYLRAFVASIVGRRIEGPDQRVALALVVGTVPGAVVGATLEDVIQDRLGAPWLIATMLVVFGVLLVVVDRRARADRGIGDVGIRTGIVLGVAQALALQPGVSRAGVTMTAARALGLDRTSAARVSFLLAMPIIGGAGLYKGAEVLAQGLPAGMGAPFAWGFVSSAISGFAVIWFLLSYLRRRGFGVFLAYRVGVAVVAFGLIAAGVRAAG